MKKPASFVLLTLSLLICLENPDAAEGTFHFQSTMNQNTLVEFYTSENLKSCNQAEAWFNAFKDSGQRFTKIIPVSFHLNRWDDRAWKDKFAIPASLQRLTAYSRYWNTTRIYAPVVVVNGVEWTGWSRGQELPLASVKIGILSVDATLSGDLQIIFKPEDDTIDDWVAHGAILGCEMESQVKRGENEKMNFSHEFVGLVYESKVMRRPYGTDWKATIKLKVPQGMGPKRRALAVWITRGSNPLPLQAAGRYYPDADTVKKKSSKDSASSENASAVREAASIL